MSKVTKEKIKEVTDAIIEEYRPEQVFLFGSQATGSAGYESDVDLFVVKETDKRPHERELELRTLLFGRGFPALDLLVYTPSEVREHRSRRDFFIGYSRNLVVARFPPPKVGGARGGMVH